MAAALQQTFVAQLQRVSERFQRLGESLMDGSPPRHRELEGHAIEADAGAAIWGA